MPAIQASYTRSPRRGLPGMPANTETKNIITRTYEGATDLPFGVPVFQGVGERGIVQSGQGVLSASASADADNVGNGTITAAPQVTADAVEGDVVLTAVADAQAPGGLHFEAKRGATSLGFVTVGSPVTLAGLTFAIAAGSEAFEAGDAFTIEVESEAPANTAFRGYTRLDNNIVRGEGRAADVFQKGDSVPVMTLGPIWGAPASAAVKAGDPVRYDPNTQTHVATGGVAIPGAIYDANSAIGEPVLVRLS